MAAQIRDEHKRYVAERAGPGTEPGRPRPANLAATEAGALGERPGSPCIYQVIDFTNVSNVTKRCMLAERPG